MIRSIPRRRAASLALLSLLAAVPLLFAPGPLAAADTAAVSGRVVTTDGEAVADAVITIVGRPTRILAGSDGRFEITGLPAGNHLLEVTSSRHGQGVERVEVAAGETVEIGIVLTSEIHGERIVVTGTTDPRGELDLATPVSVLDAQELELELEATIGQTLDGQPGINSTYFAPGASRPVIRGLSGDRVKMMENGLDTLDASSTSPDHAVGNDPLSIERVEVLRGPATLLYGSNAIGGVVNMIDGRIPDHRPTEPLTGEARVRLGSVADERAAAVRFDGGDGRWAWHLDLSGRETDDHEIPGAASVEADEHGEEEVVRGLLPNSDISSRSGSVGMSHFFGDQGFLGVSVSGFDTEYGVPGGEHGEEGEPGGEEEHGEEGIRLDMRQRRLDLEGETTEGFGAFRAARFRLGLVDYEHAELEGPGVVGTEFFNDAWEGRVELIQRARGDHEGSVGLQLRSRDLEAVGEEAFIRPTTSDSVGLFTFQEISRGDVRYQLGARYETQDTRVRDPLLRDRSFDGLSASLGAVWAPGETWSLGASLARSVKMPNGEELYSEGLHFATQSFELGNPDLGEESSLGVDLSLRRRAGRLTGELNLFYNDFSDFIFQSFTGDEVEGFPVLEYTQADAELWGAELDLGLTLVERAHASWGLHFLWDFVRGELGDGGNLPRIPPQRFGAAFHYRSDRLRGNLEVRRVTGQDRVAVDEPPTDAYTMVDASLSYRLFLSRQVVDLVLRGTNLTDELARNHASFVKDDVPLPGRDITLSAKLTF